MEKKRNAHRTVSEANRALVCSSDSNPFVETIISTSKYDESPSYAVKDAMRRQELLNPMDVNQLFKLNWIYTKVCCCVILNIKSICFMISFCVSLFIHSSTCSLFHSVLSSFAHFACHNTVLYFLFRRNKCKFSLNCANKTLDSIYSL